MEISQTFHGCRAARLWRRRFDQSFSGYELIDAALAVFTFPDHGRFVLEFDDEKSFIHRIGLFIAWITKEKPFWFRASDTERGFSQNVISRRRFLDRVVDIRFK